MQRDARVCQRSYLSYVEMIKNETATAAQIKQAVSTANASCFRTDAITGFLFAAKMNRA